MAELLRCACGWAKEMPTEGEPESRSVRCPGCREARTLAELRASTPDPPPVVEPPVPAVEQRPVVSMAEPEMSTVAGGRSRRWWVTVAGVAVLGLSLVSIGAIPNDECLRMKWLAYIGIVVTAAAIGVALTRWLTGEIAAAVVTPIAIAALVAWGAGDTYRVTSPIPTTGKGYLTVTKNWWTDAPLWAKTVAPAAGMYVHAEGPVASSGAMHGEWRLLIYQEGTAAKTARMAFWHGNVLPDGAWDAWQAGGAVDLFSRRGRSGDLFSRPSSEVGTVDDVVIEGVLRDMRRENKAGPSI